MAEETLRKVLKDFGLTDSEVEVYLFVSRHGVLSGTDVAHLIRKDKAQVFRILKNLQTKGFVEATLEIPIRFTAVAFEKVLESTIRAKKDEATRIESTKEQLLNYWKNLNKENLDVSLERFVVIEGRHKVYSTISQMIAESRKELNAVSTFSGLLRAEKFGIFNQSTNKSKKSVQFRLLTELSGQNADALKSVLKNLTKKGFNFRGKNPGLGVSVFPRMVIRDREEAVFFITPRTVLSAEDNMCLWTNCRNLVEAFTFVFEGLWHNSVDILEESGKVTPKIPTINDGQTTRRKYDGIMNSAEKEIFVMTSSTGLIRTLEAEPLLKKYAEKGVSVKIMAPIMSENYEAARRLLEYSEVKHVPTIHVETTIIDRKHLFQSRTQMPERETVGSTEHFENVFYSNDLECVEKTLDTLEAVWKNASHPSTTTLKTVLNPYEQTISSQIVNEFKTSGKEIANMHSLLRSTAIILPPRHLNMPSVIIDVNKSENQSTFGPSVSMIVFLRFETPSVNASIPERYNAVPVAVLETNPHPNLMLVTKALFAGTPAEQNFILVKPDELELYRRGNTVFAGWTIPIPLPPTSNNLPPSCVMFERYGSLKHLSLAVDFPSGYKVKQETGYYDAFLTYISPLWNYAGSGIEGMVCTDVTRKVYTSGNKD